MQALESIDMLVLGVGVAVRGKQNKHAAKGNPNTTQCLSKYESGREQ